MLELVIGPMFSGKSTELIRKIRVAKVINKRVLVLKPKVDTRSKNLRTHGFEEEDCHLVDELRDVWVGEHDLIIVDEAQFFPHLKESVIKWVERQGKDVVIAGLDGDYNRNPIGEILELIPYCDKITKLTSMCKKCNDGTPALFSFKKYETEKNIGGEELYVPVCRNHYTSM